MSNDFKIAHERARLRAGDLVWTNMSAKGQSDAIYAELRALDQERAASGETPESQEACSGDMSSGP